MSAIRLSAMVLLCFVFTSSLMDAQDLVTDVDIKSEQASFKLEKPNTLLVEIAGPNDYQFRQEIDQTNELIISNLKKDGTKFQDGLYSLQVTPIIKLPADQLAILQDLRERRDALAIQEFRKKHDLPEEVHAYTYSFSIKNGKFVYPKLNEKAVAFDRELEEMGVEHPELYASIHTIEMTSTLGLKEDKTNFFDQVFLDDVIVVGSICVGIDCNNGMAFGFDTQILQENNLRILFNDTSNSASFPTTDWRLVANDSSNGGRSYFAIQDEDTGRYPFQVEGGAPDNALIVESDGDVGIGLRDPVVELHVRDGDTPTLRLDQDGSSGFGSQIWDVAGNETNFFIRDATNGSKLPFKIKPQAPDNSLFVAANGDIGLGTQSPLNALQVESGDVQVKNGSLFVPAGSLGIGVPTPTVPLDVMGNTKFTGTHIQTGDASYFATATGGVTVFSTGFASVKMGFASHLLELSADDAVKPGGGTWDAPSDRRLKENINSFNDGLDVVMKINPVTFNYNGKLGFDPDQTHVGIIAQDMQKIAPYTVKQLNKNDKENNYLSYNGTPLTFILVNAIKQQQEIIDQQNEQITQLEQKVSEVSELKAMLAQLSLQVAELTKEGTSEVKTQSAERE
ncbi:MAG: tail fiber domain-containing protein [Saprospiraceae bacterium]|nr:tail fiber domain-containing protein [Saprospiraceae bacterium]